MPAAQKRPTTFRNRTPDQVIDRVVEIVHDWWMADEDTEIDAFTRLRFMLYRGLDHKLPPGGDLLDVERHLLDRARRGL